jgi:protein ImuA
MSAESDQLSRPDDRNARLAVLRCSMARSEGGPAERGRLGHAEADAALGGGLARGAVHEVFAEATAQAATATGFVVGLARRVMRQRPVLWVRQDFAAVECGQLAMAGWSDLGLDPRAVVLVRAPDTAAALRVAADALTCGALGAVVLETWGEVRALDRVAQRRLALAAQRSGVTALLLRLAAMPAVSAVETRWSVQTARSLSPTAEQAWGAPRFVARLLRNRRGPTGQWIMEWDCDACCFCESSAHSQPVAATPADRPSRPFARAG